MEWELRISSEETVVAVDTHDVRDVVLGIESTWDSRSSMDVRLTPSQAREVAEALRRAAGEVEGCDATE
jgi:hypothetical protein